MLTANDLRELFSVAWVAWSALSSLTLLRTEFGNITVGSVVAITFMMWFAGWVWQWFTGKNSKGGVDQ